MTSDNSEAETVQVPRELRKDLWSLVREYRQTSGLFEDDTQEARVAEHCAEQLEDTLTDYGVDKF